MCMMNVDGYSAWIGRITQRYRKNLIKAEISKMIKM